MSEPISGAAAGSAYAISKFIPILGPVLATVIVMCLATPKSRKEWIAALVSTVAVSLFGGSIIVDWFELTRFGSMATTGLSFACGLPAWLFVRALFAWMDKQKTKDITELAKVIAKEVHDIKNIGEANKPE
jgi:predicted PurR-regulated permease PerM